MPDNRIVSTTIDEELGRRFKARVADLGTTMSAVLAEAIQNWVGDWGLRTVEYWVRPGDTLSRIAARFYGDANKFRVIAHFNDIADPNLLEVGQRLLIPEPVFTIEEPEPVPVPPEPVLEPGESPFIYGIHDPGGEGLMRRAEVTGWILYTTLVNERPMDFSSLTNEGFGVLVRLNWGYSPNGTIPHQSRYDEFAQMCANWVARSGGVRHWIIGNEPNLAAERPGFRTPDEEPITPRMYATCFTKCRNAIRALPGHENDRVIPAAVAPWNAQTPYEADPLGVYEANRWGNPNNPLGDWVQYFQDMLRVLEGEVDGIALHTYTHRVNLNTRDTYIRSDDRRWGEIFPLSGGQGYYYHFRAYRDFMRVIPESMRHLPVFITEANQDRDPMTGATWFTQNLGWVQEAYAEINEWNQNPQNQKIRALLLYRWRRTEEGGDAWGFSRNEAVKEDFRRALQHRYQWA